MYGLANPVLAGGTVPRVWVVRSRKGGRLQRPFQTVSKVAQTFSECPPTAWLSGLVGDDGSELEGGAARHA